MRIGSISPRVPMMRRCVCSDRSTGASRGLRGSRPVTTGREHSWDHDGRDTLSAIVLGHRQVARLVTGIGVVGATLATAAATGPAGLPVSARQPPGQVTLSLVGTNDLHGHLDKLPALGGYLANLRRARAIDGGAVVLVDGGDM